MKSLMMEREPDSTPLTILQDRTDIFITEKKIDEVRAGSIRPELVQGFELGQPWWDLKAGPESFTENITWEKNYMGKRETKHTIQ